MPKRTTVNLNLENVLPLIKSKCRSNVVFCERMGRGKQRTWVSDWQRTPHPKNLPSPEEAARMCAILQVTPDEILTEPEDIELVRSLIEAQKTPAPTSGSEDDPELKELIAIIKAADEPGRKFLAAMIKQYKESRS